MYQINVGILHSIIIFSRVDSQKRLKLTTPKNSKSRGKTKQSIIKRIRFNLQQDY